MVEVQRSGTVTRRSVLRTAVAAVTSIAGAGLLAACGQSAPLSATAPRPANPAPTSAAATAAGGPVATAAPSTEKFTIRISGANDQRSLARGDLGKAYTKDHPNVTVVYEPLADLYQKQLIMAAGGTAGEAYQGFSINQYQQMMLAGVYADHTPLIKGHNFNFSDLLEQAQAGVQYKGKIWAIPYENHAGYSSIFINKTMFEKEGIPVPKLDWTDDPHPGLKSWSFDDIRSAALQLTKRQGSKITQWGFQEIGAANLWSYQWCIIRSFGGDFMNKDGTKMTLDTPEARDAIKWQVQLHQQDKVAPLPADTPSGGPDLFATGRIGIRLAASFQVAAAKQKYKDFEWIALPGGHGKGGSDGLLEFNSFSVLASAKHPDDTFEVIKIMTSPDASRKIREMGGNNGSWKELWSDQWVTSDPVFSVFAKTIMHSSGLLQPANGRCNEQGDMARQLLNQILAGERTDVDQAITDMNTKLQAIVDKPAPGLSTQ